QVQGNNLELPPVTTRMSDARVERIVDLMVATTARLAADPPQVTVWPENALDADPRDDPALRRRLDEALRLLGGRPLLVGTLLDGPRPGTFLNAIVQFGPGARIEDLYVKRRLVPFGEYVPGRRWLDWIPPLEQIPTDGIPGEGPKVFHVAGAVIGPVTCFESLFPRLVHSQIRAGAEALVVTTNNASFGRTPASRQHLAFSQLRAVETGRWVLHAGISGISAVVSPDGRVSQRSALFEQVVVRDRLPLVTGQTVATRTGDLVGTASQVVAATGLVGLAVARRRTGGTPARRVGSGRVPAPADRAPVI
ncbi:MAG: apolipoprotein N-acyltransferase, partial [Actinomycetota bacterium]|nr:apolipoprotein N-acyltransferase [Actinomycetota bacterium]